MPWNAPTWDRTARAPPNIFLNIKGETLVQLFDDAYYFWHPGSNTFLTGGKKFGVVIGAPTAQHWEVRQSCTVDLVDGSPTNYYTFWCPELHDKRKCVLDLCGGIFSGTRITTHIKHERDNQKWVLRSDGDVDG